jgi:hypothetical protein
VVSTFIERADVHEESKTSHMLVYFWNDLL